jgi:hypothetical protein
VTVADIVSALRAARDQVEDYRRRRAWEAARSFDAHAFARARRAKPEAKAELELVQQAFLSAIGPPPPPGDRWAVAREVSDLTATGLPSSRIARRLIAAQICEGPPSPQAVRRCACWSRQERARYRLARDSPRG